MKFFKKKSKRRDEKLGDNGYDAGYRSLNGGYDDSSSRAPQQLRYAGGGGVRSSQFRPMATRASAIALTNLPPTVLRRLFAFVCPHAEDDSYETCEQSSIEDACMLCDLRDLAHCVAVCRRWRKEAIKLLYVYVVICSMRVPS
jgi:hypothetical protein